MDITDLSAQWERIEDHAVEELRGEDNWFRFVVAQLDDILLDPANFLDRQDSSELASRHKYSITDVQDLVNVIDCSFILKLCHNTNVRIDTIFAHCDSFLEHRLF